MHIVFVEDNPSDLRLFMYALSQVDTTVKLRHFEHGQALIDQIDEIYPATTACILVDINTPFVNGFDLLKKIRQTPDYQHIPVIAFSSSDSAEEKLKFYQLGGNGYVSKPIELDELVTVVTNIIGYWVNTNKCVI